MRIFFAGVFALWAVAGQAAPFDRLMTAMQMDEIVSILAEEGTASALELEESMFPGRGGAAWEEEVARIYDVDARRLALRESMADLLSETDLDPLVAFFESDRGQRIMTLEVTARRAFIDPAMEEAATENFADAEETRPRLYEQITEFTEVNDLITQNIEGAFRSNVAFALGAHEAGAFAGMTVDQLVAQMWGGDEMVEAEIRSWMFAYLMTAYSPLSEADLDAYIALSRSEEGDALNAAIMGAFDALFTDISYDLGTSAGRFMAQQEL